MKIDKQTHSTPAGEITWFTITNNNGMQVVLSSLGAGIVAVKLPNADGTLTDVAMGYDNPADYMADGPCSGKTPGRYANRIAKGLFTLNGKTFTLPVNNGPNHLHGGPDGFQNKIWNCETPGDNKVRFTLESPDGDSGYPGTLRATVDYTLTDSNDLHIDYRATTDTPTVVNLTNHTYFNLDGHNSGSALRHTLRLNCSKWLPTDSTLIPTGEIAPVAGTPMDFTTPRQLGDRINEDFPALKFGKGYDNCWIVDNCDGSVREVALLEAPISGRKLIVSTNQPAAQVYTGNWLTGSPIGKGGYEYHDYDAVAIECQGAPDAPNQSNLPSQQLNPGETYSRTIVFSFR